MQLQGKCQPAIIERSALTKECLCGDIVEDVEGGNRHRSEQICLNLPRIDKRTNRTTKGVNSPHKLPLKRDKIDKWQAIDAKNGGRPLSKWDPRHERQHKNSNRPNFKIILSKRSLCGNVKEMWITQYNEKRCDPKITTIKTPNLITIKPKRRDKDNNININLNQNNVK